MLLDEMDCPGDCSTFCTLRIFAEAAFAMALSKETLIKSQNQISYGFLYIASSSSSLNSSDLTMGNLYKNMFPHWQKEIIHGMIKFVVVGIVSISA